MMALIQELQALLMKEQISDAAQRANKALFPYYETIQKQFGLAFADEPSNKDAQAWKIGRASCRERVSINV